MVARRSKTGDSASFMADERALQVVPRPGGAPRVSQVETLSCYQFEPDGAISGEQWQATYSLPGDDLFARPLRSAHWQPKLILNRQLNAQKTR